MVVLKIVLVQEIMKKEQKKESDPKRILKLSADNLKVFGQSWS